MEAYLFIGVWVFMCDEDMKLKENGVSLRKL